MSRAKAFTRAQGNAPVQARCTIPSLDRLLKIDAVAALGVRYGRPLVVEAARAELARLRVAAPGGRAEFDKIAFVADCASWLERQMAPSLKPVFNLTGTVLHTNLGRALMPEEAAHAAAAAMIRPVNLEYDVDGGDRGERDRHVERWLVRLTGAEAAMVVNNNAAAVLSDAQHARGGPRSAGVARRADRDRRRASACRTSWRAPAYGSSRSAPPTAPI